MKKRTYYFSDHVFHEFPFFYFDLLLTVGRFFALIINNSFNCQPGFLKLNFQITTLFSTNVSLCKTA